MIVLLLLRLLWWWGWCDAGDGLMLDGAVQDGLVGVMIATKAVAMGRRCVKASESGAKAHGAGNLTNSQLTQIALWCCSVCAWDWDSTVAVAPCLC